MGEEMLEYKCPCCGGAIQFDAKAQKLKCPYCDTEFEVDLLKTLAEQDQEAQEDDLTWEARPESQWQEEETQGMRVYACQSCGGEIIADQNTGATCCPFCGNPVVFARQFSGDLKPDLIIPFKLDKEAAKAGLKRHLSGKPLLPKVFRDQNHLDQVQGIYVPFWLFDAQVSGDVQYRASRTRVWSDPNYDYTETSFFRVRRQGKVDFQAVPVDGSSKLADMLMESIEPYNLEESVDFCTGYLAGYLADRYDVTAQQSTERANERMRKSTEDAFASTVQGYTMVTPERSSIRLSQSRARYALYPVWILNTTWKDQSYLFAMNGQTGKFVGDLPMDRGAFWRWLAGLFGAGALAAYVILFLLGLAGI